MNIAKISNVLKKLFKTGFFHIFGGNAINKVIGFLSSIILVRILTKTEYGTFTYAWNIYSIVLIFSGMGMDSGMLQLSGERGGDPDYTNKIGNYATRFGLAFNLGLSLVLILLGQFAPLKISGGRTILTVLCLLPVFQIIYSMLLSYLRCQKRNQEFAKLSVTNTVLLFSVSAISAFYLREMGLVLGHYVSMIVTSIIGIGVFHVHLLSREKDDVSDLRRDLLKISFISMITNALSQLLYLLDVFVIGIIDPNETIIASYKVATMIPTALIFIPQSLVVYIYPYFAEKKDDGRWCIKHYKQVLMGIGLFNFIVSLVLFCFAPLIINIVFGQQYLDAVPIFRILSINYFISGTFRVISGNLLVTQRKLKFNLIESVISSIINIIADYFLIKLWGAMGAALATVFVVLISSIMNTVYLIVTFKRK